MLRGGGNLKQLSNDVEALQSDVDELYERADANELAAALSKVKLGLTLEIDYINLAGKAGKLNGKTLYYKDQYGKDVDSFNSTNKLSSIFHLNMDSQIAKNLKFAGRLAMAKNWADFTHGGSVRDADYGSSPIGSSALYVPRAYLDYTITPNLVATIGRQPASEGPGYNLRDNSKRQSTYPQLMLSANGDGVVFTYKFADASLRLGYAKLYQYDDGNSGTFFNQQKVKDAHIGIAMLESKLPKRITAGESFVALSTNYTTKGILPMPLGDDILFLNTGDELMTNLYFENNNVFNTGLSLFASVAYHKGLNAVDNTKIVEKAIYDATYNAVLPVAQISNSLNPSTMQPRPSAQVKAMSEAVATGAAKKKVADSKNTIANLKLHEKDSYAAHVGLRYDFSKKFKAGYEFFWGSKYWYSILRPTVSDPLEAHTTRGMAHDIYGIYQLDLYQFFRLSYTNVQRQYTRSGYNFGQVDKLDSPEVLHNYMLTYNLKF